MNHISWIAPGRCSGLWILPYRTFFPIDYTQWDEFFDQANLTKELLKWGEDVIGAHIWNRVSAEKAILKKSNQLYVQIAKSSCPRIFHAAPEIF